MAETASEVTLPKGQKLSLVIGDICDQDVEAIINPSNQELSHDGGVSGALVQKGGKEIQKESNKWIKKHGKLDVGESAITTAGTLHAKYIIHTVGPRWGEKKEVPKLRNAIYGAMKLVESQNLKSVALPAISLGAFEFPVKKGVRTILEALTEFLSVEVQKDSKLKDVRIVLLDKKSEVYETFHEEFNKMNLDTETTKVPLKRDLDTALEILDSKPSKKQKTSHTSDSDSEGTSTKTKKKKSNNKKKEPIEDTMLETAEPKLNKKKGKKR